LLTGFFDSEAVIGLGQLYELAGQGFLLSQRLRLLLLLLEPAFGVGHDFGPPGVHLAENKSCAQ